MRETGRLGIEELICGGLPYSVGDRVALLGKHVTHRPRVSVDGAPPLRADGSPRMQRMTVPRRTRGEVIAIDMGAHTLRIRTDAHGRRPSRVVTLTAQEAAGESPQSPVRLGHGYAMTVAIAQARGWSDSYLVLSASRLTGLEQTYTAQTRATRCTRLYAGADRVLGGDMAGDWLEVRDRVKDVLAENLVRPTRKVTTLDYLGPGERAVLEERFTIPRQSPPALDSPASPAQRDLAERPLNFWPRQQSWSLGHRSGQVKPARREDGDVHLLGADLVPGELPRPLTCRRQYGHPSGGDNHVGDPMAGVVRRIGPLQHQDPGPTSSRYPLLHCLEPSAKPGHQLLRAVACAGRDSDGADAGDDIVETTRVERDHLGMAPDDRERLLDRSGGHGADPAEILSQDEIGIDGTDSSVVEGVDGLPGCHASAHRGVDLVCAQRTVGWQDRAGDDRHGPGRLRVVAVEAHATELIPKPKLVDDLGGRREQRDDSHRFIIPPQSAGGPEPGRPARRRSRSE